MDDQRKIYCGGMETIIHQTFGNIECFDTSFFLEFIRKDSFVKTGVLMPVEGQALTDAVEAIIAVIESA